MCMEQRPCIVLPLRRVTVAASQNATVIDLSIGLSIALLLIILFGVVGVYRWLTLRRTALSINADADLHPIDI